MQGPIVVALLAAGLENDCPFKQKELGGREESVVLDEKSAEEVNEDEFLEYTGRINVYLQVQLILSISFGQKNIKLL